MYPKQMMESFCWRTHQKFHVNCSSFSTELSSEERLGVFIPRLPNVIVQHQRAPGALGAHYSLHSQNHPSWCHHDQPSPSRHGHGPFLPLYYCTGPIIVREGIAPNGKCMTLRFGYFKVTIYDFDFCSYRLNSSYKCYPNTLSVWKICRWNLIWSFPVKVLFFLIVLWILQLAISPCKCHPHH